MYHSTVTLAKSLVAGFMSVSAGPGATLLMVMPGVC
jgi:hypothetical protein